MNALTLRFGHRSTACALVLAGLLAVPAFAAPGAKPMKAMKPELPPPVPGNPLSVYMQRYEGLHLVGGIAVKKAAPGFAFEIYDGRKGKERTFGTFFLPCDPTDTTGNTYPPKLSLVVMKTPQGDRFVIGESKAVEFHGPEAIAKFLDDNEQDAIRRIPPTTNLIELFKRWYDRTIKKERRYNLAFQDERSMIYQASLDNDTIGSLLLVPDWNKALPDEIPSRVKPGGVLKRVDYLLDYKQIALDDLYHYVYPKVPRH